MIKLIYQASLEVTAMSDWCKIIALLLILCTCLSLAACTGGGGEEEASSSSVEARETEPAQVEPEPEDVIELIEDGKMIYTIVRPDTATPVNIRAAVMINNVAKANGIKSTISDWGDKSADAKEILVGKTKFFPEGALEGIDTSRLGPNGFVIKTFGEKILIAASNDKALLDAAEYFIENHFDIAGGKTSMPKDYFYISSNGLFLSELSLGGVDVSDYALSCDAGMEEPLSYVKELVKDKCGAELTDAGEKKIILTASGADGDKVSAKFENGDLVIRAKDVTAMKKAVVCFWYENIGYATGTFDLPADISYSRDLSKTVFYSDFDVVTGDSVCCFDGLIAAHNYANEHGYKVFADYGAKYYISSPGKTVTIKTDVEWGNAEIIIDDSGISPDQRGNWIFNIPGSYSAYGIDTIKTFKRGMTNLGITLPQKSIITVYDANTTHYIRYGGNADNGQIMLDSVAVDKDGSVDPDAPIMWDFENITSVSVLPIDEKTLTVSGGVITTVANKAPSEYTYYARGIAVSRSNTVIDGVTHLITGEGGTGAPYSGFLSINSCAYVTVQNCVFTGHRTYQSPTTAMGSYDIGMGNSISVSFINCSQSNDINDSKYWGISGTNYCKNFVYDGCVLSRFDAHKGVANGAIKNSVIGHSGASIIGYGTFLVENSTFFSTKMISLRTDYGSSWEGDIIIRNSSLSPKSTGELYVIAGSNKRNHDFGYVCHMPTNVIIEGLIADTSASVYVFADLNSECKSESYSSVYPYVVTEKVTVKGFETNSKNEILLSPNKYLFAKTEFTVE